MTKSKAGALMIAYLRLPKVSDFKTGKGISMYSRRTVLVSVFLLIATIASAFLSGTFLALQAVQADQDSKHVKWENYVLIGGDPHGEIERQANRLGEEGWEVASAVYDQRTQTYVVFLKRPKR
jgi:hypothetical protein